MPLYSGPCTCLCCVTGLILSQMKWQPSLFQGAIYADQNPLRDFAWPSVYVNVGHVASTVINCCMYICLHCLYYNITQNITSFKIKPTLDMFAKKGRIKKNGEYILKICFKIRKLKYLLEFSLYCKRIANIQPNHNICKTLHFFLMFSPKSLIYLSQQTCSIAITM